METPEFEVFDFSEVADALKAVREQHLTDPDAEIVWAGPQRLHYKIGATSGHPGWHFSPEGLEHHADQGHDFWDVYTMVAFQIGVHNGIMIVDPDLKAARSHADSYRRLLARAHME